jgi:antitoxin component YwqK of YwqJK toxin-antitoxin module
MKNIIKIIPILLLLAACNDGLETIKVRNDDGQVTEKYTQSKTDKSKQGTYIRYYDSGEKYEEANYENDQLHGQRTIFYESGKKQIVENYERGEFKGLYQTFHENGQVQLEGKYSNNAMNGEWRGYYDSGQLKEIVQFEDNEENGPFVEYHKNGKLKTEGTYLNGDNEHGELKMYDEEGELEKKMNCNNGRCKTSWTREEG